MKLWTAEDDASIRALYETHTRVEIGILLGRSEGAVRSRCWTLRLTGKHPQWSDDELAHVIAAYAAAGDDPVDWIALAASVPTHTRDAIELKASRLGLGRVGRNKIVGGQKPPKPRKYATTEERWLAHGKMTSERLAKNGHPRGALGLKHTTESRAKMSAKVAASWADANSPFNRPAERQRRSDLIVRRIADGQMRSRYSRSAGGKRSDLGNVYFRSSWEANYARYLNWRMGRGDLRSWEFEPKTFVFDKIKRGTRAYTPDFRLTGHSGRVEWHEVKGWMDPKSITRLKRMAKYYPDETVRIIGAGWFRNAQRSGLAAVIPGWERSGMAKKVRG